MKINFTIVISLFFFIGCSSPNEKNSRYTKGQIDSLHLDGTTILSTNTDSMTVVDLNLFLKKQSFDFGSLLKEIKLVPLETNSKGLLDNVRKVVVADSTIYIYDSYKGGGIAIFDNNGKFIKRLPNGKGPGELLRLYDIDFDKNKNELVAYQHSILLFFTKQGEFIRQQRLPFGFYNFVVIPEGYIFKATCNQGNDHLGSFKNHSLFITDKNFKLQKSGMPCLPSDVNLEAYNYLHNGPTLEITPKFNDTIYQYSNSKNELRARYLLDYHKKRLPEHYLKGSWSEFESVVRNNDYYFYTGKYLNTTRHQAFFLDNWKIDAQVIVYRDKKSDNLIGGTNANYDLNQIPPIAFPAWTSGEYFVSTYLPGDHDLFATNSTIISAQDKARLKGLNENSNPVIVFFKLKEF